MGKKSNSDTSFDFEGSLLIFHNIRTFKNKIRKILCTVLTNKQTELFQNTLVDILSTQRMYNYDIQASYYPKLLSLVDLQDDIELVSNTGTHYRVKDYPHITFTKNELSAIESRYKQIKSQELSEKLA